MEKLFNYLSLLVNFLFIGLILTFILEIGKFSKEFLLHFGLINLKNSSDAVTIFNTILTLLSCLLLVYMFWIFNPFRALIKKLSVETLFEDHTAKIFDKAGKGFIIYSAGRFILNWTEKLYDGYSKVIPGKNHDEFYHALGQGLGESIGNRIPLLIMGLLLLIIAGIIKSGYVLKKENDLTI